MNETPPVLMPHAPTILKPKARFTARELYAIVQRTTKLHKLGFATKWPGTPRVLNTLRQIAAGQDVRLRTVLERDAALTYVARAKGSVTPVAAQNVKEATDIATRATWKLKTLPLGNRRVRRLAARELDRACRRGALRGQ